MQRTDATEPQSPIDYFLKVIEQLQDLKERGNSLSKSRGLLANIKNLRTAYNGLDDGTKTRVNNFLTIGHQELLTTLQKKGSQIPPIDQLAGLIDDNVLAELKRILETDPTFIIVGDSTHKTLRKKMSAEAMLDTGTFKILSVPTAAQPSPLHADNNQLRLAVDSPNLGNVSRSYLTKAAYGSVRNARKDDSLTIIINAFEILQKTKENRIKLTGELTDQFIETYVVTLSREVNILLLTLHLNTLDKLAKDLVNYPQLQEIHRVLSEIPVDDQNKNGLAIRGEAISKLIDNLLIAVLQKTKLTRQDNESYSPSFMGPA